MGLVTSCVHTYSRPIACDVVLNEPPYSLIILRHNGMISVEYTVKIVRVDRICASQISL